MTWNAIDMQKMTKVQRYEFALACLEGMVREEGTPHIDDIALMATICSLVKALQPHAYWVGFYRLVADGVLVVGPYQGTPGCLEIRIGRGVCGAAALERRTIIVGDVENYPGHISCDAASRSEIVLPVFDALGNLTAVLDIDSSELNAFDEIDEYWLSTLLAVFKR